MKKTALSFSVFSSFVLMVCYTNCSQFKVTDSRNIASNALGVSSISGSVESEYQIAEDNIIPAFQDRMFRFKIPHSSDSATFNLANLPSWVSVDNSTGELYGVPTVIESNSSISMSVTENGSTTALGPYTIRVAGNPLKSQQWHLKNLGQNTFAGLAGLADQDIHTEESIRDGYLGKGIRIAISDSGVYEAHRGLAPNIVSSKSRNYLNNYAATQSWLGNSTPSTAEGEDAHGTAVAGLAAERGWTNLGGRGVAPLASLSGFLFIQAQPTLTDRGYLSAGIYDQFAGDFDIFNYSWGDPQCYLSEYPDAYSQKLLSGVSTIRGNKGALYFMAAGNDFYSYLKDCYSTSAATAMYFGNANTSELATTPYTIIVAAVNANGKSSSYSSPGANIWVSAPGGEYGLSTSPNATYPQYIQPALIAPDFVGCSVGFKTFSAAYSPFNKGTDANNSTCEHLATMNGTSGATPIASGTGALILNANPNLNWREVKHILAVTADQVDPNAISTNHPISASNLTGHVYQQGWVTNSAGYKFHNWYGFGRINVDKAVNLAKTFVAGSLGTYQTTGWKYDSGALNVTAPAGSATGITRTLNVTENWSIESAQVKLSAQSCIGNIGVELTSPSGTKSILMNINSGILETSTANHVMLSNAFYGENSAGTWSLKLISGAASCTPTLVSWQLNISGH
jgi:subtilisin family serine protease